jgi:uncharacterized repeat protein (TIGR01451 family)
LANNPSWGSFFIPQGASVAITFTVNIPAAGADLAGTTEAAVGTYHNAAGVTYLDPTRTTVGRVVSPPTNIGGTGRAGTAAYSANTTYASGANTTITGSNSNGLEAGPVGENVTLLPDLSITKVANGTFSPGVASTYTITPRNNGRAIRALTFATDQATVLIPSNIVTFANLVSDTLPAGLQLSGVPTGTNWTCTGVSGDTTFACTYTGTFPLAALTNLPTITVPIRTLTSACPGPQINTATITTATGETLILDNTTTATTTLDCNINITLSKTDGLSTVVSGQAITYTISLSNAGPAAADGAILSDPVGTGVTKTGAVACIYSGAPVAATGPAAPTIAQLEAGFAITTLPVGGAVSCTVNATVN